MKQIVLMWAGVEFSDSFGSNQTEDRRKLHYKTMKLIQTIITEIYCESYKIVMAINHTG